ncbi:MAG: formylglycine-generating enzyme family protein [Saprospiraceae bacterium]|nr:formylglycine-generating enzyme family protein [Saprospiraceae bacterium]
MTSNDLIISLPSGLTFQLVYVEGGEFMMGDEVGDLWKECQPVHPVRVSSYYVGKYPVTQELWQAVMGSNPSGFIGGNRPVETVSWEDSQRFIEALNRHQWQSSFNLAGVFRLPSESQWEYAARGGRYSQGYRYTGSDRLSQVGWNKDNSEETREVGLLLPNELGLYDMSGNVWEWCEDWYAGEYYERYTQRDYVENPAGPQDGDDRVLRGGSCFGDAEDCRLANRDGFTPDDRLDDTGFRLVFALSWISFRIPMCKKAGGPCDRIGSLMAKIPSPFYNL